MGMHFHLAAVQPRWDSPQDLFGFYNYLEKKYKATELSRALIQFEMYNRDSWDEILHTDNDDDSEEFEFGADDRSDRMLLVLLDEMNLARVEYYFSEFLSKLETRRTVDVNDDQNRARAEIELDMGSLIGGKKALRLYPGPNVLFVGTMNEDESTQSLSDKVVDRASVQRFWRPSHTAGDIENGGEIESFGWGLQLSKWNSWKRPFNDLGNFEQEVSEWISRLNDSLEQMGRPFAYRVDQAMRAYIANYPRGGNIEWHKLAMADQIEQRIFSKIRGVETEFNSTPLLEIGRVIDELGDDKLKDAYRLSHENQPTFLRE